MPVKIKLHRNCESVDCPELTKGKCWLELPLQTKETVRELRDVVRVYNDFEAADLSGMDGAKFVTPQGWHMLQGVLTDRIYQLSGSKT